MKNKTSLFSIPYVVWMALFVVLPILMVVIYAFSSAGGGFTLANFARMGTYAVVIGRSFKLAVIATIICILIGYPLSYMMAKEGARFQRVAMVLNAELRMLNLNNARIMLNQVDTLADPTMADCFEAALGSPIVATSLQG